MAVGNSFTVKAVQKITQCNKIITKK